MQIRDIAHFKSELLSFITLRKSCNNQWPRCDIIWLHVAYHGFPKLNGDINITYGEYIYTCKVP
jgi:hypothetical protein